MHPRSGKSRLFVAGRVITRAEITRLRESYLGIADACDRKPRPFADASSDETRISFARPILHAMLAMDAADSPEKQGAVLNGYDRYTAEGRAILKARLRKQLTVTIREAISNGQRDDMDEEVAETAYLIEPTPANRARWISALQKAQQSAAILEMHLRAEDGRAESRPTLSIA